MIDPRLWQARMGMFSQNPTQAGVMVTPNRPQGGVASPGTAQGGVVQSRTPIPQANPYMAQLARSMMGTGASTAPVLSPVEGIARTLTGALGGYFAGQANEAQQARQAAIGPRLAELTGLDPEAAEGLSPEMILGVAAGREAGETWRQLTPSEASTYGVPQGEVWQISNTGKLRKPGAAGTTIQLPGEPREKFTDTLAGIDAKRYEGWAQAADTASDQLGNINRARSLLDQGLETGRLTALSAPFGEFMQAFGVDPESYGLEDVTNVQEFTAIANTMVTDLTSKLKGALSDRELRFLERATIGIQNTPEANRAIMDMLEKGANQQIMRLGAADEWIAQYGDLRTKNEDDLTFMQAWNRYLSDNEAIPETVTAEGEETEVETRQAGVNGGGAAEVTVESVRTMPVEDLRSLDMDKLSNDALDAVIERLGGGG